MNKWHFYTRGAIPLFRIELFIQGIFDYQKENKNFELRNIIFYGNDKKVWMGWKNSEIQKICNKVIKQCHDGSIIEYLKNWKKQAKRIIVFSDKFLKTNLKKISEKDLLLFFDKIHEQSYGSLAIFNTHIDAIDIAFENELIKMLKKELKSKLVKNKFLEFYRQASRPVFSSYVILEETELLKVKLGLNKKGIQDIVDRFWWTVLGWEGLNIKDKKYFLAQSKLITKVEARRRLLEIEENLKKTKKIRKQMIKKYKLSKKAEFWLNLCDKFALAHDLRKETQMRTVYCFSKVLAEKAKRIGTNFEDLEHLTLLELREVLKTGMIDHDKIKDRKKAYGVLSNPVSIEYFDSKKANKLFKKEIEILNEDIKEFFGMSVGAQRNVLSKVKVCAGYVEAIKKIKKGDILVCGMTLPEYVPAMKLASAIITNEGGITCHAAILSRELDIPCIVGTKVATEVLKDGMKVKMDTKRGIVKII